MVSSSSTSSKAKLSIRQKKNLFVFKILAPISLILLYFFIAKSKNDLSSGLSVVQSSKSFDISKISETDMIDDSEPLNAIVHVGPGKIGSTTIQVFMRKAQERLAMDEYLGIKPTKASDILTIHPDTCENSPSWKAFVKKLDRAFYKRKSVLVSEEYLSNVGGINMTLFQGAFQNKFQVKIVVGYRRYFEWIRSYYYQLYKKGRKMRNDGTKTFFSVDSYWPDEGKHTGKERPDFVNYARALINANETVLRAPFTNDDVDDYRIKYFTTDVVDYYKRVHGYETSVYNLHDNNEGGLLPNFFCGHVPNATHICHKSKEPMRGGNSNEGQTFAYDFLAVAAYQEGLLGKKKDAPKRKAVAKAIEYRQEKILRKTEFDFPLYCLSPKELDALLTRSLNAEKSLLPDFFASPHGEKALREKFELMAKTKLCDIDTKKVLEDKEWYTFFQSLKNKA